MQKVQLTESCPDQIDDLFSASETVYAVYRNLLEHHKELSFLFGKKIKILEKKKPKYSKGKKVLGTAKAFTPKDKLLHLWDGLVTLDRTFIAVNPSSLEPLLFHELCHFSQDEEGRLVTIGHDLEDFFLVYKKYGDWKGDLRHAQSFQLNLSLDLK